MKIVSTTLTSSVFGEVSGCHESFMKGLLLCDMDPHFPNKGQSNWRSFYIIILSNLKLGKRIHNVIQEDWARN